MLIFESIENPAKKQAGTFDLGKRKFWCYCSGLGKRG
jgi:hypothetical protein